MNDFTRDPHYLLRYGILWILACLTMAVFFYQGHTFFFSSTDILFTLLTVPFIGPLASIFHNSTHGSVINRKINRLTGEILGLFFLYGYQNFRLGHLLHHRYTDDPELDPDYRNSESFAGFLMGQGPQAVKALGNFYLRTYGNTPENHLRIKLQAAVIGLSMLSRLIFWFSLLGPKAFILFYLPVALGNILVFAHINYVTHSLGGSGIEVKNEPGSGLRGYLDFMTFGGYHHKNHHLRPGQFHHAHAMGKASI